MYNVTGIMDNTTGILTFMQGVNDNLMAGLLGILILIAISIVVFIAFMQRIDDTNRAVAATSFVTLILALLLSTMGLIRNSLVLYVVLILAAGSIAFTWKSRSA